MGALKNFPLPEGGDELGKEEQLIRSFAQGSWSCASDLPGCSPTELVTVALAIGRYDLLSDYYADPLEDYFQVLDDRQRAIVKKHRGW